MAFPDVDPAFISLPQLSMTNQQLAYGKSLSRRELLEENTNSFDQPHLWYSTSEVIRALDRFIASGDKLSRSSTYR